MTLKFNDYALINGHPRGGGGGLIFPGNICGHGPLDLLTFNCCQFLAQDGGLDCFCNFIAESLRKRPQGFVTMYAPRRIGWERE